ncbi:phosphinothricin acetyltransferase [Salinibacterium sp. CAN_S4]|uniref:GNAT family N-acetyltransferase n=1 Tax=Salinibacterium sp. CAN_S4 TaxID=2787727 RepID=UPI0018EFDD7C
MQIRPADDSDLDAILEIHNHAIRETTAIWTEVEVGREDRELWLAARQAAGHPVIVAEVGGVLAGYAAYGPWREKSGYRLTVENSVYVAGGFQRRGVAMALMVELIRLAKERGIHVMIAAIDAENAGSIALHRRLGFGEPMVVAEVGLKFGRWLDLAFMRLQVSPDQLPRD